MVQPRRLLTEQIQVLATHLPGVFDGKPDSVHDARIAIRRIRELLPIAGPFRRWSADQLDRCFKRAGRALGPLREVDAQLALIASLQRSVPTSAPGLVVLQQHRERERDSRLRSAVKRLESLALPRLLRSISGPPPAGVRLVGLLPGARHWRRELNQLLASHAGGAENAIDAAAGVYFPNRLHAARIAVKRLRYAMEISDASGGGDRDAELRQLRKAQETLGDLHDRETLLDAIEGLEADLESGVRAQLAVVAGVVGAECRRLHSRYLERRVDLLEICSREPRPAPPKRIGSVVSMSVVALSVGYAARQVTRGGSQQRRRLPVEPIVETPDPAPDRAQLAAVTTST